MEFEGKPSNQPLINMKDSFLVNNFPIRAGIMKKQILAALTPFALI
jgi:hypothetical protein